MSESDILESAVFALADIVGRVVLAKGLDLPQFFAERLTREQRAVAIAAMEFATSTRLPGDMVDLLINDPMKVAERFAADEELSALVTKTANVARDGLTKADIATALAAASALGMPTDTFLSASEV